MRNQSKTIEKRLKCSKYGTKLGYPLNLAIIFAIVDFYLFI